MGKQKQHQKQVDHQKKKKIIKKEYTQVKKEHLQTQHLIKQQNTIKEQHNSQVNVADHPEPKIMSKEKNKKHNRIILRNLIIDINEKHIRKLLNPYGKILEINIPKDSDKSHSKGFAFVQFQTKNQCHNAINKLNGTSYKGRTIILDHSISKQSYLQQKLTEKPQPKKQQSQSIIEQISQQQQQNEQQQEQQESQKQEQQQQIQDKKHEQDLKSTVFIRNIPISITDQQLYQFFKKYGKIKYARIAFNPQTKVSKGSGFVKFVDANTAHTLVQYSRSYQMFLLNKLYNFKPDPKITLQMDGKIIKIFHTETRGALNDKITARSENTDDKKKIVPIKKVRNIQNLITHDKSDKRNLKLAVQGLWRAQQQMKKHQYQKFKKHERQKLQKLKNPNHFVSQTRVVFKFLDKDITQSNLKDVACQFLRNNNLKTKQLTYCKLMLDNTMTKSAGFAFLQFNHHQTALDFMHAIIQNPQVIMDTPFVCEFAIEDSRKLLKKGKKIWKTKGVKQDNNKNEHNFKNKR